MKSLFEHLLEEAQKVERAGSAEELTAFSIEYMAAHPVMYSGHHPDGMSVTLKGGQDSTVGTMLLSPSPYVVRPDSVPVSMARYAHASPTIQDQTFPVR